ncbi:MAG TPA: hypothetical protein P5519_07250 [Spirochaetia bacterium]|nr:hypothetical protein [Spirochaetales bacterium]HRS65669.1 hypothetical protein [Spirochaetia bacterium]HOT58682.1 hypothetical protein [Spirochaetales bacterium]HPD79926.1 hypothetical protein [Spirochaetales bacterium]HQK33514.1 hypothetical protein [Spirochaetales bacterium]
MLNENSVNHNRYNQIDKLVIFNLPLFILSSHIILALIFSAVFILSFLCLFLISHMINRANTNQFLFFSAKLLILSALNAIIQSVILIIDPYLYTLYSMHISFIQFLPFLLELATQDEIWSHSNEIVIKTIILPVLSILFAFFRESITYGTIEFTVKNYQTLKPVTFYAGFSPWFAFLCIAFSLILINVARTKLGGKRGSHD